MSGWERHRLTVALQDERSQNPESTDRLGHRAKRTGAGPAYELRELIAATSALQSSRDELRHQLWALK